MPTNKEVLAFCPFLHTIFCATNTYLSILQEFEDKLKKIKGNTAGRRVSFYNTGINSQDCARLCEALEVHVIALVTLANVDQLLFPRRPHQIVIHSHFHIFQIEFENVLKRVLKNVLVCR